MDGIFLLYKHNGKLEAYVLQMCVGAGSVLYFNVRKILLSLKSRKVFGGCLGVS